MKEESLTIEEMKELSRKIIREELESLPDGHVFSIYPMTFVEYNQAFPFNDKSPLKIVKDKKDREKYKSTMGLHLSTSYTDKNTNEELKLSVILITIDNFYKLKKNNKDLVYLVFACYHEVRHAKQFAEQHTEDMDLRPNSYDGFFGNLDHLFANLDRIYDNTQSTKDYNDKHNTYYFEIDANNYGIKKAKEFIKKEYPESYSKHEVYLNQLEKEFALNNLMYDASNKIDKLVELSDIHNRAKTLTSYQNISSQLDIFLTSDNQFKAFKEIINDPRIKELDSRVISAFFSSKSFLKSVNVEELSSRELNIIRDSLNYTRGIYEEQERALKEIFSDVDSPLQININSKINNKEENINKVNNLIRAKSRGYLRVDMLYLIAIMIMIITITYLVIK